MAENSPLRSEDLEPNLVDRVVSYFDPMKGLQRRRARAQAAVAGRFLSSGYTGGSSTRKALQEYDPFGGSASYDHLPQQGRLRARSRDLARNSTVGTAAVGGTVTSTVGTGLRLQSQVDAAFLGMTEDEAQAWQQRAERIWRIHSNDLDIEGELNQPAMQLLVFRSVLESGDLLAIRRYRERAGSLLGTRIQLVESDRISNPLYRLNTNELRAGVETTREGRVMAYHVSGTHPGDMLYAGFPQKWSRVQAYGRNGNRLAKLLFERKRPGQRRGVPFLAPVIESLKQLERLSEAELMAAVVSSLFTVFIKTEGDDDVGGLTSAPEGTAESEKPTNEGDVFLGSGAIVDLLPGEEPEFASPTRPNDAFEPFFRAIVMQIGMALEIPYEVLVKNFQSSYSASRAALLEAWRFIRGRRQWLSAEFCAWEYELVISEAVARGLLPAPGFFDSRQTREAYLGAAWIGDAPGQVDPLKEVKAARERVEGGFSTITAETQQLTGGDFEQNVRQRRREVRMLEEAGVAVGDRTPVEGEDDDPDRDENGERAA